MISLIKHFEADFLWKVSLKILNSGIILKTFTHVKVLTRKRIRISIVRQNLQCHIYNTDKSRNFEILVTKDFIPLY